VTTWITRRPDADVKADLSAVDPALPLAGLRLAVKDNIDVAGLPTTAACPGFAYQPEASAPVVERLVAAGATVLGKTNLDQFASGLVGTRSPYGACESPLAPGRVSGGSSSGSAIAVATGEADLAFGTDTAGSGRVPAMFCGIVGLKPTPGWLSLRGVVPASPSFDCVSVFARDVATAALGVEHAAGYDALDPRSTAAPIDGPSSPPVWRIGVPDTEEIATHCEPGVAEAFADLVARLPALGFEVVSVDVDAYIEAGQLLYGGPFVAERHAAVWPLLEPHLADADPTVAAIVRAAGAITAPELLGAQQRLWELRRAAEAIWATVDAVLLPTAPRHPTLAEVAAEPIAANAALGRYTNGCNLLAWCGAAVPVGTWGDGLPFGVTLFGAAWTDRAVWAAAATIAGQAPPAPPAVEATGAGQARVLLAVCGAHLQGQPLNHQLTDRGATIVARTTTAPAYRMAALPTSPPKPGCTRVADGGAALEVEVWALTHAAFGDFVAEVPSPLAIGTVELVDGTWVKGFVCEPFAVEGAEDITAYGGWRAWLASHS
jgi:allophanate hydrolase